ncbi:MAG: hypothetical protein MI974_06505 [Chitinophagales bacterium]|nr:hypothetical protein [Chitinophagales bacterium]
MHLKNLHLRTHKPEELWTFYTQVLGFEGKHMDNGVAILYNIGSSHLIFSTATDGSQPYYHFAFNIPYNQYEEALNWLKERVEVLKDENGNELIEFTNWEAYAIYFFDPAGNILEFIARKDIPFHSDEPFSIQSVLSISEIGIPVNDVPKVYEEIKSVSKIPPYKTGNATFFPTGNAEGLFILVNQSEKIWYPTQKKALSFPLYVEFEQEGTYHTMLSGEGKVMIQQAKDSSHFSVGSNSIFNE